MKYVIDLVGLNRVYMKKLSIWLQKRLQKQAVIRIWEDALPKAAELKTEAEAHIVLAGAEVIGQVRDALQDTQAHFCVAVSPDRQLCGDEVLYMYQPADMLYNRLFQMYERTRTAGTRTASAAGQQIYVFFGADACAGLLPYALTGARILSQERHTLFVNLCSCSGMRKLLGLSPSEADLSDLFLALRKGHSSSLKAYTGQIELLDYISQPGNPGILDELTAEDFELFLENLPAGGYETVVIAQDGLHFWTKTLIAQAAHVVCLTDECLTSRCRLGEIRNYYEKCGGSDRAWHELRIRPVHPSEPGEHLLYEWETGMPGRILRQMPDLF